MRFYEGVNNMVEAIGNSTMLNSTTSTKVVNTQNVGLPVRGEHSLGNQKRAVEDKRVYEEKRITEEEAIRLIEKANKDFIAYDRRFEFSIHETTKQIMVKIIDINTEEVIRELPPEKILDIVAAIWEVAGIIDDRKI